MGKCSNIRLRFAPSPTGLMHIGNVRTALMNYLFVRQKGGTFILRIEDTDAARNYDPGAQKIIADLAWLGLKYDEGPIFQSNCAQEYERRRALLEEKKLIYRCFCTHEELERKRQRQVAMKLPPRYDRTCQRLSKEKIELLVADNTPFIWRVLLDHSRVVVINDMARGEITFDLRNFSDFAITRPDGSTTFLFANFVDDMAMKISHVVRGEDHLTNTACQAFLYQLFNVPIPIFWHLPMLCNIEGKKLSKRDFGFSLGDIRFAGFHAPALLNYLAISGGGSFKQEIMSGQVQYDIEKLKWVNHKWIERMPSVELAQLVRPFLDQEYGDRASWITDQELARIVDIMRTDLVVFQDAPVALEFYFKEPIVTMQLLGAFIPTEYLKTIRSIVISIMPFIEAIDTYVEKFKSEIKKNGVPIKYGFFYVRIALTGKPHGPSIASLCMILGSQESQQRIKQADWVVDAHIE
jgi:glutamyl-tRNA synthetase